MPDSTNTFTMDIINAINKRDFVFQRVTNLIARKLDFVFEGIIEYLNENAHEIQWESIDVSNNLLVIVARLVGHPTPRVLNIGIPFDVIEHQSKDKIVEFFLETEKLRAEQEQEYLYSIFSNDSLIDLLENNDEEVDSFDEIDDNVPKITSKPPKRILH